MTPPLGLDRIPTQRIRAYAWRMRRRRPIKVREIAEPRRTLELAALLSVTEALQSDTVLRLIEMRIAEGTLTPRQPFVIASETLDCGIRTDALYILAHPAPKIRERQGQTFAHQSPTQAGAGRKMD